MTTKPTCGTCRFFTPLQPESDTGACRRNPPTVVVLPNQDGQPSPQRFWPGVSRTEWCGCWGRRAKS